MDGSTSRSGGAEQPPGGQQSARDIGLGGSGSVVHDDQQAGPSRAQTSTKVLMSQRVTAVNQIRKLKKHAGSLSVDGASAEDIEAQLERLEHQWMRFCTAHDGILLVTGTSELPFQVIEREAIEPVYEECKRQLEELRSGMDDSCSIVTTEAVRFRNSRDLAKSRVDKVSKWTDAAIGRDTTGEEIQDRLLYLDEMWSAFYTAHDNMVSHAEGSTLEDEEDMDETEELYFLTKAKLRRLANTGERSAGQANVRRLQAAVRAEHDGGNEPGERHHQLPARQRIEDQPVFRNNLEVGGDAHNRRSQFRMEFNLPKVELPKFSGGYSAWTPFRDQFTCMIGADPGITDVHKLHYLKSCVGGEAETLIRAFPVTGRNFELAWAALTRRYGNTRLVVNTHIQAIFDASSARADNVCSLRKLMDTFTENVSILTGLDEPTAAWDSILVLMATNKLDADSARQWEMSLQADGRPTFQRFQQFIESRCRALEAVDRSQRKSCNSSEMKQAQPKRNPFADMPKTFVATAEEGCQVCGARHRLYACQQFLGMPVTQRRSVVVDKRLCFNCLAGDHQAMSCTRTSCRSCQQRHHTLLHEVTNPEVNAHLSARHSFNDVLLATARVQVEDRDGKTHVVRALIDTGSHCSFVTESCVQQLRLHKSAASVPVSGIGLAYGGHSSGITKIKFGSTTCDYKAEVQALVLSTITSALPPSPIAEDVVSKFEHVKLADPQFNIPAKVDLLLGADICGDLELEGKIPRDTTGPSARNTVLGWVVIGPCGASNQAPQRAQAHLAVEHHSRLEAQVKAFWEVEEVPEARMRTAAEVECEQLYVTNTTRGADGRYIVRLPFTTGSTPLGQSRSNAVRSMLSLEKRFRADPELKVKYVDFMREYERLGHMERATSVTSDGCYYLPHLAVVTNKMRVVFDASRRTSTGRSLNDQLLVGPRLQDDIIDIVMRFRCSKVAVTADIAKMYRQIVMSPDQRDFQRILWREDDDSALREYRLTTVTYGTSSAPYLAVRTLIKLADDDGNRHPLAAEAIRNNFYVDDLMAGGDDVPEATELQRQLVALLASGGFELRKWASSHLESIEGVPSEHHEKPIQREVGVAPYIKTLGLVWCPTEDELQFRVAIDYETTGPHTKRSVLSEVSKLYDPLGLLTPVVVVAKIFLQSLWRENVEWDEELREALSSFWELYRRELTTVQRLRVPRWIGSVLRCMANTQLHGFCDASEKAYCAVLYARTSAGGGTAEVRLVVAKSRVAPTKQLTIPRLELCGAHLLAKLLNSFRRACGFRDSRCLLWTDSELVLWYLKKQPADLKTFVRHRVSSILDNTQNTEWRHVPSAENPADMGSRGVMPAKFGNESAWWRGPAWLAHDGQQWPAVWEPTRPMEAAACEVKSNAVSLNVVPVEPSWIELYSDLTTLTRVTAFMLRFAARCRDTSRQPPGPLTVQELTAALDRCIISTQSERWAAELACCAKGNPVSSSSALASLVPFADGSGLLRVGGRLQHAALPSDQTHQVILPPNNHLSTLIIRDAHVRVLHGSVQMTVATLRQRYWMIGMRREVSKVIIACVRCLRWRQRNRQHQLMGSLPVPRVSPNRAFLVTGVDFAGPLLIKSSTLRGNRTQKAYIAVFVCFSTRAIHLELVSDLTSAAFIAALHRFIARRGRCAEIHSDCGTNFVGADAVMREWLRNIAKQIAGADPERVLAGQGIQWRFIPPGSPTFGGLWESAVKSTKHHLRRVLSETPLTFECMTTVLTQVEACLNSRPLCAMSDDPDDLAALTPGHFLIGEPMNAIPQPDLTTVPANKLSRWQNLQLLVQHFWRRWQTEYMMALQIRGKWRMADSDLRVGDLVLVVDERLPPTKWPLGRVVETFPGADGHVRVVSVRAAKTTIKRSVRKLCRLPTDEE